jgi:UDP-3-O-[3-hydroxymyristoyl] N-acetylglucosamine deacetylase/3-hydroxyacyl-[acyl-carrier-protein] dehydratase
LVLNNVDDPENYSTYFLKINNVKFKQKVIPGDTLIMDCRLTAPIRRGICQMEAKAYVGNKLVCEGELVAHVSKND